jgi:NADPH-dependent curcumin reductase CurA
MLQKIDKSLLGKVPLSYFLGAMGMPGMTAYAGIKKIAGNFQCCSIFSLSSPRVWVLVTQYKYCQ